LVLWEAEEMTRAERITKAELITELRARDAQAQLPAAPSQVGVAEMAEGLRLSEQRLQLALDAASPLSAAELDDLAAYVSQQRGYAPRLNSQGH
jgi:hypothetical protein